MKTENKIKVFNFAVILKTLNMDPGHFSGRGIFFCQSQTKAFLKENYKDSAKRTASKCRWNTAPIKVYIVQSKIKGIICNENCEDVQVGSWDLSDLLSDIHVWKLQSSLLGEADS